MQQSIYSKLKIQANQKLKYINKAFQQQSFYLLDVGAGNQSASKIKKYFPNCKYYGLDMDKNTNYIDADFKEMEKFYELDLTKLQFDELPDQFFDYINIAHVIEHLHNGDEVLKKLQQKLKPNGFFYIEYPSQKSTTLPSMKNGTLNFYDDETHVRIYSIPELKTIFESNNFTVLESGTRRNLFFIVAMPFRIASFLLQGKKLIGNIFWDILGFAEFIFVQKK